LIGSRPFWSAAPKHPEAHPIPPRLFQSDILSIEREDRALGDFFVSALTARRRTSAASSGIAGRIALRQVCISTDIC
jgi:hypothetical protein